MFARLVLTAGLLLCASTAFAQFPKLEDAPSRPTNGNGDSRIPISTGSAEVLGAEGVGASSAPAPIALEHPIDPQLYICGPGDVFEVNFWGQQNFRLRISADVEGRTFISKVGYIDVAGKTLAEVRTQAKKKIRQSYPGLQVDLALMVPRTFRVHLVNFVKQPGTYEAHAVERVGTVLARAGGVTGSRRRIGIRHRNGKQSTADLQLYELTGDTRLNPYLLDGDIIDVPAAKVVVSVSGAVRRPGSYELTQTVDLAELINLAGGLTSSVAPSLPLRITRRDPEQRARFVDVAIKDRARLSEKLEDEDIVTVPSAAELQRTVLLVGAVTSADAVDTATTLKRLPFVEGDTVRSLIERAGGIRTTGDLARAYISRSRPKGNPELIPLDLETLLIMRDFSADKPVNMNDVIVVPAMQLGVLIEGAVGKAGLLEYNPRFGVPQYIARAGGRTSRARDLDEVKVVDPDGNVREYHNGLKIKPGDSILVPERNFTRGEIVQLSIAVAGLVLSGVAITLAATR